MTTKLTGTRIHRATSPDCTRIAGEVHGEGPPLALGHMGPLLRAESVAIEITGFLAPLPEARR